MKKECILQTGVCFQTKDKAHQEVYDLAVKRARENIFDFGGTKVMIEGSDMYRGVWIETQPMGGEIYAAYDARVALGNQLIFMRNARADGRLPGAIFFERGKLRCRYDMLQGYCFPQHALNLYYWTKAISPRTLCRPPRARRVSLEMARSCGARLPAIVVRMGYGRG